MRNGMQRQGTENEKGELEKDEAFMSLYEDADVHGMQVLSASLPFLCLPSRVYSSQLHPTLGIYIMHTACIHRSSPLSSARPLGRGLSTGKTRGQRRSSR